MKNIAIVLLPILFLALSMQAQQENVYKKSNITEHVLNVKLRELIYKKLENSSHTSSLDKHKLAHFYIDNYSTYKQLFSNMVAVMKEENKAAFEIIIDQIVKQIVLDFQNFIPSQNLIEEPHNFTFGSSSIKKGETNDKAAGDPCNNADFETCDFTGWDLFDGNVNNQPYQMINITPSGPGGHHTITTPGMDPLVPIPTTDPNGGGCSVMLGDFTGTGSKAASMRQTFLVTPQSTSFTYSYALVLEDPSGHTIGEKPFFKVNMYDQNNNPIACGQYEVISGPVNSGGDPDFIAYGAGFYLPWRTTFAPLNAYVGQNVTIEFIIGDCSQSGHYGYGYIEANCSPLEIIESDTVICNGQAVTLTAPAGATSYLWSPGGQTTQSITTATPGNYSVEITPVSGSACSVTLTTTIYGSTDYPVANFTATPTTMCVGESVTVNDLSYVVGTSSITGWAWDFDGDGLTDDTTQTPTAYTYTTSGTYNLQLVVWNNGCTDTLVVPITVNDMPTAGFSFNNVCYGSLMNFTDTSNANGGVISNWNWDFTNNGTVDNMNQNPAYGYPTAGSYDVELLVETSAGCKDSVLQTVIVNPLPVANFSAPNECLNTITQFTDLSTVTTGSITDWAWDFGDGDTSSLQQPTHLYTTANTFNVSLTVTTDSGCTHNVVIPVTVYAKPTAAFTTADVCQNLAAQFNSSTSTGNGGTINQWDWDFDFITPTHTTDATTQNPSNNYASAGTYTVDLIVTTSNGCSDTVSNPITIFPMPTAAYTFTNECFGTAIPFTDNSSVSTGTITNWSWVFGNTNTSTTQNPSELYVNDGQYNVTLTVTTDNGCQDDVTQTVTVYPLPVVDFTPTDVCLLETTQFTDLSTVTTGTNVGWAWNFDDNTTSNIQHPTHTYGTEGVYQVKLIVTTNNGCKDSITKPVTVHPLPQVSFIPSVLDSCSPVIVDFTDQSTINLPGTNVTWNWDFGDAGTSTQQHPNAISFVNTSNSSVAIFDVSLTVTSDKGCSVTQTINNMIKSYPIPLASFTYNPTDANIYNSEISFTDNSIIASWWLWDLGDGASSTVRNPVHLYADSGIYTVILYMENEYGCEDTTEKIVKINPVFVIFIPNAFTPDEDGINDYFFATGYGITQLETLIFDRWGELIYEGHELESKWDGKYKGTLAKTEVYSYKIKARDVFGQWHEYIGKVSLIK
ncbi:MAG: PKD domain-containing protein [Vicingaceae bacterium]|nr:PKD domain-containing protein [Vicingaceae bacterium]